MDRFKRDMRESGEERCQHECFFKLDIKNRFEFSENSGKKM